MMTLTLTKTFYTDSDDPEDLVKEMLTFINVDNTSEKVQEYLDSLDDDEKSEDCKVFKVTIKIEEVRSNV